MRAPLEGVCRCPTCTFLVLFVVQNWCIELKVYCRSKLLKIIAGSCEHILSIIPLVCYGLFDYSC